MFHMSINVKAYLFLVNVTNNMYITTYSSLHCQIKSSLQLKWGHQWVIMVYLTTWEQGKVWECATCNSGNSKKKNKTN